MRKGEDSLSWRADFRNFLISLLLCSPCHLLTCSPAHPAICHLLTCSPCHLLTLPPSPFHLPTTTCRPRAAPLLSIWCLSIWCCQTAASIQYNSCHHHLWLSWPLSSPTSTLLPSLPHLPRWFLPCFKLYHNLVSNVSVQKSWITHQLDWCISIHSRSKTDENFWKGPKSKIYVADSFTN